MLGGLIAVCTFVGFVASRTVGLPSFKANDWEVTGIVSLLLEAAVFALWIHRERRALMRAVKSVTPQGEGEDGALRYAR